MTSSGDARHAYLDSKTKTARIAKVLTESTGLLRGPQRVAPLLQKLISDKLRVSFEQRHLYSYASTKRSSEETLRALLRWMLHAQRRDGGIAAYYSLLTGYSESYPEVTGYIVPTLYDLGRETGDERSAVAAERATRWLLALQMPSGAFPGGLHGAVGGVCFQHGADLAGIGSRLCGNETLRDFASCGFCRRLVGRDAAARWVVVWPRRLSRNGAHLLQHGCMVAGGIICAHRGR